MTLPINYSDEAKLHAAFSWLTRVGIGPKFGTRPISWYQAHQCHALDALEKMVPSGGKVRVRKGVIEAQHVGQHRWFIIGTPEGYYRLADELSRG